MLIKLNEDLLIDIKEIKAIYRHAGEELYSIYFKGYKDALSHLEITKEDFDMINKILIKKDNEECEYFKNTGYNCL